MTSCDPSVTTICETTDAAQPVQSVSRGIPVVFEGLTVRLLAGHYGRADRKRLVGHVVTLTRLLEGAITITLNVLLVYYDAIERLVIRDCSLGGLGRDLIP